MAQDQDSAQDVASGVLRLTFGGEEREVPTLKLRASREWLKAWVGRMPLLLEALNADQDAAGQRAFVDFSYESAIEVILDYDRTGALGGREWLEEHADPTELYRALRRMARVAVPFGDDLQTLMALLLAVNPELFERPATGADASASSRSTRPRSPNGTSARPRSKSSSTRGS